MMSMPPYSKTLIAARTHGDGLLIGIVDPMRLAFIHDILCGASRATVTLFRALALSWKPFRVS
jgi:hypothetical protein